MYLNWKWKYIAIVENFTITDKICVGKSKIIDEANNSILNVPSSREIGVLVQLLSLCDRMYLVKEQQRGEEMKWSESKQYFFNSDNKETL